MLEALYMFIVLILSIIEMIMIFAFYGAISEISNSINKLREEISSNKMKEAQDISTKKDDQ